jgi:hypothetical protein
LAESSRSATQIARSSFARELEKREVRVARLNGELVVVDRLRDADKWPAHAGRRTHSSPFIGSGGAVHSVICPDLVTPVRERALDLGSVVEVHQPPALQHRADRVDHSSGSCERLPRFLVR